MGRILKAYVEKGKINPSKSAFKTKRKRVFKKHAERWKYGMKGAFPGQLVQVDHMTVSKCSHSIKHFQAWDPSTKTIIAEAYSSATSRSAKKFLDKLIQDAPFPIQSIQVDGGSEFMLHFEEACHAKRISLYVLPPRRPQYNGGVERGNRTFREEFYSRQEVGLDAMSPLRQQLKQAVAKYNTYRPHAIRVCSIHLEEHFLFSFVSNHMNPYNNIKNIEFQQKKHL